MYPQRNLRSTAIDTANLQTLLLMLILSGSVLWKIAAAKRATNKIEIRKIAGLNAIDEAIGRSTELGAPVLFNPGIADYTNIATLAALGLLAHVARKCAEFGTPIIVTTNTPVMAPICESVLKSEFDAIGMPEMLGKCDVRFISTANDLTALGTAALMVDRKVGSVFLFGSYDYTCLLYSEGGQLAGCMQIAGTADYYEIPFFIASCDYTVIVEELFACSSYLSRDPVMLGSVVGQDYGKIFLLCVLAIGVVSATVYGSGNPLNVFGGWLGG